MRRLKIKEEKLKRSNRLTIMLNNREMRALNIYCQRYRVKNKSRFLRETVMSAIVQKFNDEMPSLWEVNEPDLFSPEVKTPDLKVRR
ncbi:MAG TPA: hypothetical protein ENH59_03790 [Bacteroidetes bacterium]|nr:hypothetical protein [Bacteroidota bacterium]